MKIKGLYRSAQHIYRGHHGVPAGTEPMAPMPTAHLVAGKGIEGDRYSRLEGAKGQVTFFAEEAWERLRSELGVERGHDVFRRNIVVEGSDLNSLIGREFEVQGIRFRGVEYCKPCRWMDDAFGPGTLDRLAQWQAGGLRAAVLSDGVLAVDSPAETPCSE